MKENLDCLEICRDSLKSLRIAIDFEESFLQLKVVKKKCRLKLGFDSSDSKENVVDF